MNWDDLYCANRDCFCYGVPSYYHENMVKNGSSRGQKQGLCKNCGKNVSLRYATAYQDLESDPAIFEIAVRASAEGNSMHATARILNIGEETVRAWLDRVASHCRLVTLELWNNLRITECQLDELRSFVHTKEGHLNKAKHYKETYGDAWVWIAFAPVPRSVLAFVVGKRNQDSANLLLRRVKHVTDNHIPLFTSDQLKEYKEAILQAYGEEYQPKRIGDRGRFPKTKKKPLPNLLYAQAVKNRNRGCVCNIHTKIIFGNETDFEKRIKTSSVSSTINTSFAERDNLTQRQNNRRLTRKTNGFSKELNWLEKQLWLSLCYYHLVLPHKSLRRKLQTPIPTKGSGSQKIWQPITPAMEAKITDHVWDVRELLSYRIYPYQIEYASKHENLFPPLS